MEVWTKLKIVVETVGRNQSQNVRISVSLPQGELPFVSGWYLSKISCIDSKPVHIKPVIACKVVNCPNNNLQIDKMRWCKGVPMPERHALIDGVETNAYQKVKVPQPVIVKTEPPGESVQAAVVRDQRTHPRSRPYARTDDGAGEECHDSDAESWRALMQRGARREVQRTMIDREAQRTMIDRELDELFGSSTASASAATLATAQDPPRPTSIHWTETQRQAAWTAALYAAARERHGHGHPAGNAEGLRVQP